MDSPTLDCRVAPVISRLYWLEGNSNFNGPLASKPRGQIAPEGFSATPGRGRREERAQERGALGEERAQ